MSGQSSMTNRSGSVESGDSKYDNASTSDVGSISESDVISEEGSVITDSTSESTDENRQENIDELDRNVNPLIVNQVECMYTNANQLPLRANFLYQHINKPTRFRGNQTCRTLDLVITKDESNIDNINIDAPLGLSDHATITIDFLLSFNEDETEHFVINQDTVEKYLLLLNGSKSMGPDNIHPLIVKSMAKIFSKPLTLIFQKSIDIGKIPKEWKDARVTPLFKNKGSKLDAGNYRPVSLTSIVCKTLEKVLRKEIIDHLVTNNLLSDSQFGFRSGRSCILQLLDVIEDWSLFMDDNISWDTLYRDFAKAFDKVPLNLRDY
ncbi:unnamed protein product [Mytilus coruscus]|uniref:Reverse transcriptase domain-containing protein n=1 Tax=Mytilus coruscus TaxID=42192 RepID=A0A6J8CYC7_MYTCO|nr:unnamed protein product [Mytilus coruscus]